MKCKEEQHTSGHQSQTTMPIPSHRWLFCDSVRHNTLLWTPANTTNINLALIIHWLKRDRQSSHYILVLKFKDFSKTFKDPEKRAWSCIFKDQFSTEVYSMDSITAIFNIYFCDLQDSFSWWKQNMTIISKSWFRQNTHLTKLLISCSLTWWMQGLSRSVEWNSRTFKHLSCFQVLSIPWI